MNLRAPRVGDVGAVVEVLASRYVVECVSDDGTTSWLSDFSADELELVDSVEPK